jgi:hypothetical protein
LGAFLAEYADADVGSVDHGDVVGTIADGHRHFVRRFPHQLHHLGLRIPGNHSMSAQRVVGVHCVRESQHLLERRGPTADNGVAAPRQLNELVRVILERILERMPINDAGKLLAL